jgi:multidrug transporter EmrE-like cation transporter
MKPWILYTLVALIFYGIGEYCTKIFANSRSMLFLVAGFIMYMLTTALWFPSLRNNNRLVIMTIIWDLGYIIVGTLIGIGMFGEVLSIRQWAGVCLSILAIILLTGI